MPDLPELNPQNFTNRELSNLDFNRRVLALAQERDIPLLERIKFIAIVGNNLDEFFMVRVGGYIQKVQLGITSTRPDGYTPSQLLAAIRQEVSALMQDQRQTMRELLAELEQHGIFIKHNHELTQAQQQALRHYFYEEVFPVLTPLAADHARPFPFISNLSLNLGVYVRHQHTDETLDFVRIKVPPSLPRLIDLGQVMQRYAHRHDAKDHYIWIEDLIASNLDLLFPGMEIVEHYPFRVTRNADIDYEHERDEELLDISTVIEASLKERRFGFIVRMSVPENISTRMLNRLIYELDIDPNRDVYKVQGALGTSSLFELAAIDHPELKYPTHVPKIPEVFAPGTDIFAQIREHDLLIHHPYDSFKPVEEFFQQAARDPKVLAIKATLYRVGKNSPVVQSLMEARENNKQVAVLVELKARFDEENNLEWARQLEHQGVHVTYGVEKLAVKTHAKIALVVRKEGDRLRRYVHLGTGNYNASTARLYTDLGLFTANPEIAEDATRLFNRLTGYAPSTSYHQLLVAPEFLQSALIDLIDNEIEHAQNGEYARLIFKMNQLEEDVMIQKLYQASQAGVQIDLIVRGLCCLRAGLPGISENIRVRSIVGRFLEHSRIYYFHNAPPDQRIYIGSADLMRRNLYNRVETVFPIIDPRLQRRIRRILATDLKNNTLVWIQQPDGSYQRLQPAPDEPSIDSQYIFTQDSAGLDIELD
ncbi:MAG: polyphosphate kinase 1 [Chloroflexi bacterium]|nr:MAG: polyphosphate kinase 1 [Chloroflexota bacterium]